MKKSKLALIIIVYWFLLIYAVAALLFWFVALNNQNSNMATLKINALQTQGATYQQDYQNIISVKKRKTAQYIGEGTTFLAILVVGALFVYRSVRKQLRLTAQQQNFIMAVTHELKTPIAITQLNLETLRKRKLEPDKQEKLIGNTLQEVTRLNNLCNNILLTSQFEGDAYANQTQEIHFSELVEQLAEVYTKRFSHHFINTNIETGQYIKGDALLLEMLLNNLVENAAKYSPKQTTITIELTKQHDKLSLAVKDEGPGIAEEDKTKVFEKFYRAGNEATRTAKGTGLGLYLCKKIVENHNGYISMTNNKPTGSIFTALFNVPHE